MLLQVTICDYRIFQDLLPKDHIVLSKDYHPTDEQIGLTRDIAKYYWRILKAADFFWDDELREVLPWLEKKDGPRADTDNIWPLWTIEDCIEWIHSQGCQIFHLYKFREIEMVEAYIQTGPKRLVFVNGRDVLTALLKFILRKLENQYD